MKGVDPSGLFGGGFPDPNDDSPLQDKRYTFNLRVNVTDRADQNAIVVDELTFFRTSRV